MPIQYAPLGPIKYLTIHCTATPEGRADTPAQIAQMDIKRFGQESYHWIVPLAGSAERRLTDVEKGAHVGQHNSGNIGISYVGGVDANGKPKDTRTPSQIAELRRLVAMYRAKYPNIVVLGHRDWSPDLNHDGKITPNEWLKSCPCFDVKTQL